MGKKSILFDWIPEQFTNPPPLYADLTGKTVLVVGANTGIGFDAAKHFAQMGPKRLILGCRNEAKGRNAIERKFISSYVTSGLLTGSRVCC